MFAPNADAALVERVATDMASAPPEVALPAMESTWTFGSKVPGILRGLGIPIAAINAEEPASDLKSMHEYGIDVTCMPGVGHFLMMEQPERFNECLLKVVHALLSPVPVTPDIMPFPETIAGRRSTSLSSCSR